MDMQSFRKIIEKYLKIYNINRMDLEGDTLNIRIIYNISKEKLSKPVYRNFEITKKIGAVNLEVLEENLNYIFQRDREYRIVDPEKLIKLLDIEHSLEKDHDRAIEEIKEKIFHGVEIEEAEMRLSLSNDIVSISEEKKRTIKYRVKAGSALFYVSSLKLHTIEYVENDKTESYDKLFEVLIEADSIIEKLIQIQRRRGEVIEEGQVVTGELLNRIEALGANESEDRGAIFKSYHHYLTNDINRFKSSEILRYKGKLYEIIKIEKDGYLIVRHPEKSIVTDDKLIERITIKYKMLHGEIG